MSKRIRELFLFDTLIAILKIEEYTKNISDALELRRDLKSWDAVLRELEIIGEAVKNLLNAGLLPENKRIIVDFRNFITHEYFGIDEQVVWDVIQTKLPELKRNILNKIEKTTDKKELIDLLVEEYKDIEFLKTYLEGLK